MIDYKERRRRKKKSTLKVPSTIGDIGALAQLKKEIDNMGWLKEAEDCVRRGEILQAVKIFKENQSLELRTCKDAVDEYRRTGNWNHHTFLNKSDNLLDKVFKNICGETPKEFKRLQSLRKKDILRDIEKHGTTVVSVSMALRIAEKYAQEVLKLR